MKNEANQQEGVITNIYNDMWCRFATAVQQDQIKLDPYLTNLNADTRRGISALSYLKHGNQATLKRINEFLQAVKALEPQQYYHPPEELHLTLLSVISCVANFQLADIDPVPYSEIFSAVIKQAEPIEICYQGVTASPDCIVIQGFPVGDGLAQLRDNLRDKLHQARVKVSFDSRYKLVTAHSTAVRFCYPLRSGQRLLKLCQQYRNYPFGTIQLRDFELVFNNWYQNLSETRVLSRCSLSD